MRLAHIQPLGHQGDHIGLADGLAMPDGSGAIGPGELPRIGKEKFIPRHMTHRLDHQGLLSHGAAHQHPSVGLDFEDLSHGVDASHVGHENVHRDQVGLERAELLDRLEPALRFAHHLQSGLGQNVAEQRPHEGRVVAHEHRVTHGSQRTPAG